MADLSQYKALVAKNHLIFAPLFHKHRVETMDVDEMETLKTIIQQGHPRGTVMLINIGIAVPGPGAHNPTRTSLGSRTHRLVVSELVPMGMPVLYIDFVSKSPIDYTKSMETVDADFRAMASADVDSQANLYQRLCLAEKLLRAAGLVVKIYIGGPIPKAALRDYLGQGKSTGEVQSPTMEGWHFSSPLYSWTAARTLAQNYADLVGGRPLETVDEAATRVRQGISRDNIKLGYGFGGEHGKFVVF
jgi:hypothetical protein